MITSVNVRLVAETGDSVAYEMTLKRNDGSEQAKRILFNKPFDDSDLGVNIYHRILDAIAEAA